MCMFGVGASRSTQVGHQAPFPAVLCSRAKRGPCWSSYSLDAVIWSSRIGSGPFTNGTSDEHVGANVHETLMFYAQIIHYLVFTDRFNVKPAFKPMLAIMSTERRDILYVEH